MGISTETWRRLTLLRSVCIASIRGDPRSVASSETNFAPRRVAYNSPRCVIVTRLKLICTTVVDGKGRV